MCSTTDLIVSKVTIEASGKQKDVDTSSEDAQTKSKPKLETIFVVNALCAEIALYIMKLICLFNQLFSALLAL